MTNGYTKPTTRAPEGQCRECSGSYWIGLDGMVLAAGEDGLCEPCIMVSRSLASRERRCECVDLDHSRSVGDRCLHCYGWVLRGPRDGQAPVTTLLTLPVPQPEEPEEVMTGIKACPRKAGNCKGPDELWPCGPCQRLHDEAQRGPMAVAL